MQQGNPDNADSRAAATRRRSSVGSRRLHAVAVFLAVTGLRFAAGPALAQDTVEVDAATAARAHEAFEQMLGKFPPYSDQAIQRYVQTVGARLAGGAPHTNITITFTVLDSPGIFAYSFADGSVVVSRGMLAHLNSEAQLAAVMAHEIGHVVSLHQARALQEAERTQALSEKLAKRFSGEQARDTIRAFSFAHVRGYSREHEIEADVWGERLLERAGYDKAAGAQTLRAFLQHDAFCDKFGFELWEIPDSAGGEGVFATHPSTQARIELARERIGPHALDAAAPDPAYLAALRGLVSGLPERYGVQRGNRYLQPRQRVAFTVPQDWYLFGVGDRLVAAPRGKDGLLMIWMKAIPDSETRRDALRELARGRSGQPAELRIGNSVKGETAVIRVPGADGPMAARIAVLDVGNRRISLVGFTYLASNWDATDPTFLALIRSIRAATAAEARAAVPLRLQVERARIDRPLMPQGQPFPDLARERWELLNQLFPAQPVATGRWIKVVR
jgi:predicted Zn-dependent protease